MLRRAMLFSILLLASASILAQDNYEIQVYGAETVAPRNTMIELHSNFTVNGSKTITDGVLPTQHALHETIEITQGFNSWFETGLYIFTSARSGSGWQWVGDHIRPRVRAPESWHWPVGVSISNEIGYQRRAFSTDTWTWDLRPTVDEKLRRWYWSFNPAGERPLKGDNARKASGFIP